MSRQRAPGVLLWGSVLAAWLLALLPVPAALAGFKPFWLGLVVAYWALETPERMGLGRAFVLGLLADLVAGTLLGEQAVRLCILVFLVARFRPRLRFFPLAQQSLAMLVLLANDRAVTWAIRVASGEGVPPAGFWLAPVAGMLLWPWLFLLLDRLSARMRTREG
ncbi:MAG: rod shape-determining protein MreD [Lysobacteraceae bacterium]|nr:MAG: rod shape-determining protein MreD [Xanthomonadaceae bacterium]